MPLFSRRPYLTSSPSFSAILLVMLVGGSFAAVPLACSATSTPRTGDGGNGGEVSTNGGQGGVGNQGGDPVFTVSSGSGNPGCTIHCSADLHQVLDCNNNVVQTCPMGQGCEPNGTCIEACAAAEANGSTIGCDFYAAQPSPILQSRGGCYAALLANTWDTAITLKVEYDGQALDPNQIARVPSGTPLTYSPLPNGELAPGQIAIVFLAHNPASPVKCPTTPGILTDASVIGTGLAKAFRITASAPVVAYDMYPYGGAPSFVASATLLIPTPAWGTNYILADAFEQEPLFMMSNASPFVQIVAKEDNTNVTISPTKAIYGSPTVAATGQGQPKTYTINKGQVLQFLQIEELAGSPLSSDKPVSVWGGSGCMNIPIGDYACDCGHQQLLPVNALGNEYAAVRYRDREANFNESVPWTIIGAVDGTTLTYDPAPPSGAPTTLASGQMVRFYASQPFMVKSQDDAHPFSFAGHMTGWDHLPGNPAKSHLGDPEYVISIPPAQYLRHYLFLTDPTYKNSHLVFVRQKTKDGTFMPVTLECLGEVSGWQPIGASGQYEFARVDLVVSGQPQGACNNGVHTADSNAPFGLTVWGWDNAVSYAYPAGMSTEPINTVVVPPVPK
jgi:hypothetical protein